MQPALTLPAASASAAASTDSTSTPGRATAASATELSHTSRPPLRTLPANLLTDWRLSSMAASKVLTMGELMASRLTMTVALAVPPRCSGPYDGIHDTSRPS